MTIIPDDTASSGRDPAERINEIGVRAEDSTRRIAAAIAGALEGFVEALEEYDLANEGRRAVEQAGEVTRAAAVEGKAVAQTPEMQQVGHGLRKAGEKTSEVSHRATEAVKSTAGEVRENIHDRTESVKYAAYRAKEEVKVRAGAVAETGRRARVAPGVIRDELSEWFAAWKRGIVASLVGAALLAVFATIALIVLTIALVVGLNELIGDPAGTFLVALLYVVVAGIAYAVGRSMRARAAAEREERIANAREELRHVVRPVKEAFGGGRTQI